MGKQEVIEVLEKSGNWMSAKDISKFVTSNIISIYSALRSMEKSKEIEMRKIEKKIKARKPVINQYRFIN